jgi:hypothetical protein
MLVHHLGGAAPEWRSGRQHLPECYAKRVDVRLQSRQKERRRGAGRRAERR